MCLSKEKGLESRTAKGRKAIHIELEKQRFSKKIKKCLLGHAETRGNRRNFDLEALPSLPTTPSSYCIRVTHGDSALSGIGPLPGLL